MILSPKPYKYYLISPYHYDQYASGGQNVNKLNTKAEVRFHVLNADWMPDEVKQRLSEQQVNRINNMGELLVTSQEHR